MQAFKLQLQCFHNTALKPSRTFPWMPVRVQPTTKVKSKNCLFASCESGKKKFGIIEQLCEQPYTSKEFQWTAPNVFKKKNQTSHTNCHASNVSPPSTVATEDYAMWFPTHVYYYYFYYSLFILMISLDVICFQNPDCMQMIQYYPYHICRRPMGP